jgi:hypothetical protein
MADEKSLGQVGFDIYGEKSGEHGPWKTYDGRTIPQWDSLAAGQNDDGTPNPGGPLTLARWEAAADAIAKEHMRRQGFEFDAFSGRWKQKGPKDGPAINWNRTTGA